MDNIDIFQIKDDRIYAAVNAKHHIHDKVLAHELAYLASA